MGNIVKYHNDINKMKLGKFTDKETDIFFSIMFKSKETTGNITIHFSELKNLIEGHRSEQRLVDNIRRLNLKLKTLVDEIQDIEGNYTAFNLFGDIITKPKKKEIEIKIDERFKNLINNLMGNFTKFDLKDLISLDSIYSKTIFRLLKQWETTKERTFSIEEFRELLAIPEKYRMSEINKKVLAPAMEELPTFFSNLKLEKIKTGKKITTLKFTWKNKIGKIETKIDEMIEVEISEHLNTAIEKAKNNRFIKHLLNTDNIEILMQMFEEKKLIKGLLWSYKEVQQEIASLNYLIKTIKTGIDKKEKQLVIKKAEAKFDKYFEKVPFDFEKKELEEITRLDYEKLYQEYLKKHNISNLKTVRKGFDISNKKKYKIVESEEMNEVNEVIEKEETENKMKIIKEEITYQITALELEEIVKTSKFEELSSNTFDIIEETNERIVIKKITLEGGISYKLIKTLDNNALKNIKGINILVEMKKLSEF